MNRSVSAARPTDPALAARLVQQQRQLDRVAEASLRTFLVPLQLEPPVGLDSLSHMMADAKKPRTSVKQAGEPRALSALLGSVVAVERCAPDAP